MELGGASSKHYKADSLRTSSPIRQTIRLPPWTRINFSCWSRSPGTLPEAIPPNTSYSVHLPTPFSCSRFIHQVGLWLTATCLYTGVLVTDPRLKSRLCKYIPGGPSNSLGKTSAFRANFALYLGVAGVRWENAGYSMRLSVSRILQRSTQLSSPVGFSGFLKHWLAEFKVLCKSYFEYIFFL